MAPGERTRGDPSIEAPPVQRKVGKDRGDLVAAILRGCVSIEDFVDAARGVLSEEEVRDRHDRAPNWGQFRMVISNRMRGEIGKRRKVLVNAR